MLLQYLEQIKKKFQEINHGNLLGPVLCVLPHTENQSKIIDVYISMEKSDLTRFNLNLLAIINFYRSNRFQSYRFHLKPQTLFQNMCLFILNSCENYPSKSINICSSRHVYKVIEPFKALTFVITQKCIIFVCLFGLFVYKVIALKLLTFVITQKCIICLHACSVWRHTLILMGPDSNKMLKPGFE